MKGVIKIFIAVILVGLLAFGYSWRVTVSENRDAHFICELLDIPQSKALKVARSSGFGEKEYYILTPSASLPGNSFFERRGGHELKNRNRLDELEAKFSKNRMFEDSFSKGGRAFSGVLKTNEGYFMDGIVVRDKVFIIISEY